MAWSRRTNYRGLQNRKRESIDMMCLEEPAVYNVEEGTSSRVHPNVGGFSARSRDIATILRLEKGRLIVLKKGRLPLRRLSTFSTPTPGLLCEPFLCLSQYTPPPIESASPRTRAGGRAYGTGRPTLLPY